MVVAQRLVMAFETTRGRSISGTAWTVALAACVWGACSAAPEGDDDRPGGDELEVYCEGKCDGLGGRIRSLVRDARTLDLADLVLLGAGPATGAIDDLLTTDGVGGATLEAPHVYALSEVARDDHTLVDLERLTSGLATRFGERELTTEVNAVRVRHLQSGADRVYAETAFRLSAGLGDEWSMSVGGLAEDANVSVGFVHGAIEGRVIDAYDGEIAAGTRSILAAVRSSRGFVVPRSIAEVRSMRPGESMALRGEGSMGINLGAGVPILIAQPVAAVGYSLVVSAALRAHLEGAFDVQLVRLEGDEVVLDVGTERARVRSARLALDDAWGVTGLAEAHVTIGGQRVDLGRLLDRALQSQLDRKLSLVSASIERTGRQSRVSLVRLRFRLDAATDGLEEALGQALRGDVRLAQALAARGDDGVRMDHDLLRSGVSSVSHAGIDLFGMSFFSTTELAEGDVVVQTPGGAQALAFDSLHHERGWLFSTSGYTRVGLSGLRFDPSGATEGDANLFLQVLEGDDFMERDKLLDHVDPLLLALVPFDAFARFAASGNAIERHVEETCQPSPAFDPCRTTVLSSATVIDARARALSELEAATTSLEDDVRTVVLALARMRLTAQATLEPNASLVGPPTSVLSDLRLGDAALENLTSQRTGADLRRAVEQILRATEIDRDREPSEISRDAERAVTDAAPVLTRMAETFDAHAARYAALVSAEHASIEGIGQVGARALSITIPLGADRAIAYDDALAQSVPTARARVARDLFDALRRDAAELDGPHAEQIVAYALLAMTPSNLAEVRVDVDLDTDDRAAQSFDHYRAAGYASFDVYGAGSGARLLGGGLFDLDALMDVSGR